MLTICKDCGVQGKGVHHCEQYHNQAHSIVEYQRIEKELQAKIKQLEDSVERCSARNAADADLIADLRARIDELEERW